MPTLSYQSAGESHGPALLVIVDGMPSDVAVDVDLINAELSRRQGGYGRGGRQRIETDVVQFLAGVRKGRTNGAPIAMQIANKDSRLDDDAKTPPVHRPRPGHADLAGSVKWLTTDCRNTLERASARETACRVAAGALARSLLQPLGIEAFGFVRSIHQARSDVEADAASLNELRSARDGSEVYCPDEGASARMVDAIHFATTQKDTVGGLVECHVFGVPIGIGSCMNWSDKLDSRLAAAVMGIQAFKAVEIGIGTGAAERFGSEVHDPIHYDAASTGASHLGFTRSSNNAGGLEGGMTNGQPVVVRGTMKPISTLLKGLPSVDLNSKEAQQSQYERSDICAVSAASVVMENVVAFEVARALREKFGGDSWTEMRANFDSYHAMARQLPLDR